MLTLEYASRGGKAVVGGQPSWAYLLYSVVAVLLLRVAKTVEPKRQKLQEAENLLASANAKLKEKQDALAAVISRVEGLKQQLANAQSEQRKLTDQVRLLAERNSIV